MVRWVVSGHERHLWNVICMMVQCILQIRKNFLVHLQSSPCVCILHLRNCVFTFFIIMAITNVICWIPKLHFLMTLKGYASKCNSGTLFCALNDHFFPTLKYSDLHNGFSYVSCQICASFSSSMLFNNVYVWINAPSIWKMVFELPLPL